MKRPLIGIGVLSLIATFALIAGGDDDKGKPAPPQQNASQKNSGPQPNVSITPRAKVGAPETITDRRSDIRVDTDLVLIYVSVTDPIGRYVTGLDKENFKLTEEYNGKKSRSGYYAVLK
jgi:hypothetical protein